MISTMSKSFLQNITKKLNLKVGIMKNWYVYIYMFISTIKILVDYFTDFLIDLLIKFGKSDLSSLPYMKKLNV